MNKQFLIAWLIIFIAWMFGSFVVHGMLLQFDYVVQPMPGLHVVKQIVFDGILVLILGAIAAFLYRGHARQ